MVFKKKTCLNYTKQTKIRGFYILIFCKEINMVVIRLARGGSKKRPFYKIVVTERRNRRDGRLFASLQTA